MPRILTREHQQAAIAARWSKPENVEYRVNKLAEHIRHLVETAPPLTAEQAERLRALLPTPGRGAAA